MNPLTKHNMRLETRWAQRSLALCPVCSVRVMEYDQARHAAKHEREARDEKLTARKQRAQGEG